MGARPVAVPPASRLRIAVHCVAALCGAPRRRALRRARHRRAHRHHAHELSERRRLLRRARQGRAHRRRSARVCLGVAALCGAPDMGVHTAADDAATALANCLIIVAPCGAPDMGARITTIAPGRGAHTVACRTAVAPTTRLAVAAVLVPRVTVAATPPSPDT